MHVRRRVRLAGAPSAGIFGLALAAAAWLATGDSIAASVAKGRADATAVRPLDLSIAIDGPPVAVARPEPGRVAHLAFRAKAGQRVGLGITGVRMTPASASALVVIVRGPHDERVSTERIHCFAAVASDPEGRCDGEFTIVASGRHTVEVDPPFSAAASYSVLLSTPVAGKLAADHPQEARLRRVGQDARFEFQVEAGSDMSVEARHVAPPQGGGAFRLKVFRADGTPVAASGGNAERGASVPLPGANGAYIVEVDPDHGATGTFLVGMRAAGVLALGGPPMPFSTSNASEVAGLGFEGHAGQSLVFAIEGLTHTPDVESNSVLAVLSPDGSRLAGVGCMTRELEGLRVQPCKLLVPKLPVSGHYRVAITPPPRASVAGRLIASEVLSGTLSPGTPQALAAMKQAQVARYTFAGKAGDTMGVELSGVSMTPVGTMVSVKLERPDGLWMSMVSGRDAVRIKPIALPASGTYSVVLDTGLGTLTAGELTLVPGEGKPE